MNPACNNNDGALQVRYIKEMACNYRNMALGACGRSLPSNSFHPLMFATYSMIHEVYTSSSELNTTVEDTQKLLHEDLSRSQTLSKELHNKEQSIRAELEKIQASSTEIFHATGEDTVDGFVQGGIDITSDSVKQ